VETVRTAELGPRPRRTARHRGKAVAGLAVNGLTATRSRRVACQSRAIFTLASSDWSHNGPMGELQKYAPDCI